MGTLGISTNAEAAAVLVKLRELSADCYEGVPQGHDMSRDAWGEKPGYRDVSFGSILPNSRMGRALGLGEPDQPHGWSFEVAHTGVSKEAVRLLSQETDLTLIGWAPTTNATDIKPFYYVQYDSRNTAGVILSYTAVRFYECTIGVLTP